VTKPVSLRIEKPQFKVALKILLCAHSFYSVDEIFACTDDMYYWFTWLCQFLHCHNFMSWMLLYVFDMFHILLSGDSLRDLWNVCICMYEKFTLLRCYAAYIW